MKKLLLLAFVLLAAMPSFSQNVFPATGNVGIGTGSPSSLLHVVNNGRNYLVNHRIAGYTEDGAGINYLLLHKSYTSTLLDDHFVQGRITAVRGAVGSWNRKFSIEVNTASAYNSNRGSLISYNEFCSLVTLTYNSESYLAVAINNGSTLYNFSFTGYVLGEALTLVRDDDVSAVKPFTDVDQLTIQSGILVNKALAGNETVLLFGAENDRGNMQVPLGSTTGGYNIDFRTWRDVATSQIGARIRAERVNGYVNNNALRQPMDLAFYTSTSDNVSSLKEQMRILNNGNIGIGISNPEERLCVNGTIKTKKVVVTATGWPDYVFNPAYDLRPLDSIQAYINTHKHLPGIPAAAEVLKNGHDLGEIQKALLEKTEEITLYLLKEQHERRTLEEKLKEQDAKLTAQEARLNEQAAEIQTLQQALKKLIADPR